MRTRIILWIWIAVLVPLAGSARANPQCQPWGVNTLRGDVQALLTGKGVIEISPPDEFVYAVIDGAAAT